MEFIIVTLCYILIVICIVFPPAEIVAAGFTIAQLFDDHLGSENSNFITFHMKRISLTLLIHSALPFGYVLFLWLAGLNFYTVCTALMYTSIPPLLVAYKIISWQDNNKTNHPVVKALSAYAEGGSDWRTVASDVNTEYRGVDKVSIDLSTTSKFVATYTWLMKVTQYNVTFVKQSECSLVVTGSDIHDLAPSGIDAVQYMNIKSIPIRPELPSFKIRITSQSLRELQYRLRQPVRMPDNLSLLPTVVERFITVFKQYVAQNPEYYVDEVPELCMGCMQVPADVKLNKRCSPEPGVAGNQQCQICNCRVVWCCSCMARWWWSRGSGRDDGPGLGGRCTCPVCRSNFCLHDVSPVVVLT